MDLIIENKRKIVITLLVVLEIICLFLLYKSYLYKDTMINDTMIKESNLYSNSFALMIETEKSDGTIGYVESESNSWPTNMKFNSKLSGCLDMDGNKIADSLSYDSTNNTVIVSVGETAYCYVYFDLNGTAANYLIKNVSSTDLWNSTIENDGYRYIGENPNNYICFGTTDKNTCLNDTKQYMYRIIGIFKDESGNKHLKLIKKDVLDAFELYNAKVEYSESFWKDADFYQDLNGVYFLNNESYSYLQEEKWAGKIATWNYVVTNSLTVDSTQSSNNDWANGLDYAKTSARLVYLHELRKISSENHTCYDSSGIAVGCNIGYWDSINTKISLMYASDYLLSLGNSALDYTSSSNASQLKASWLHLSNNDSLHTNGNEWTMTQYGYNSEAYLYAIQSNGKVQGTFSSIEYYVRPVFYLESDVEFSESTGNGAENDPLILLT